MVNEDYVIGAEESWTIEHIGQVVEDHGRALRLMLAWMQHNELSEEQRARMAIDAAGEVVRMEHWLWTLYDRLLHAMGAPEQVMGIIDKAEGPHDTYEIGLLDGTLGRDMRSGSLEYAKGYDAALVKRIMEESR